jgi:hypothetical protein
VAVGPGPVDRKPDAAADLDRSPARTLVELPDPGQAGADCNDATRHRKRNGFDRQQQEADCREYGGDELSPARPRHLYHVVGMSLERRCNDGFAPARRRVGQILLTALDLAREMRLIPQRLAARNERYRSRRIDIGRQPFERAGVPRIRFVARAEAEAPEQIDDENEYAERQEIGTACRKQVEATDAEFLGVRPDAARHAGEPDNV